MALLKVVAGPGAGEQVDLAAEAVLGRFRGCELQIKDVESSRRHARIFLRDGKHWAEDLESSNGTFVNEKRISERVLYNGDRIRIGTVTVEYVNPDAARPTDVLPAAPGEPEARKDAGAEEVELVEVEESRPKEPMPALPGHVLVRRLWEDDLSATYLATETAMDRPVAVEILSDRFAKEPDKVLAQLRAAAQLEHPAFAHIYRAEADGARIFFTREPTVGRMAWEIAGKVPADEVAEIGADIACALAEAHAKGLAHGSLRPDRIVRTQRGHAKLLGTGLPQPRFSDLSREPDLQKRPSRVAYAAPEQVAGGPPSPAADLYSLGATLYHLLCGRAPFAALSEAELAPKIASEGFIPVLNLKPDAPKPLARAIEKLLSRAPGDRFGSMAEAAAALEQAAEPARGPRPVLVAQRPGADERSAFWPATVIIVVLSILLLAAVFLLARLGGISFIRQGVETPSGARARHATVAAARQTAATLPPSLFHA